MYTSDNSWVIAIAKSENQIIQAKLIFNVMIKNNLGHLMITSLSERKNYWKRYYYF